MERYVGSPPYQWQGEINRQSQQLRNLLLWFPLMGHDTSERLVNLPTTRGGAVSAARNAVTGQCWNFTGASGDYIDIGDTSLLDFGASDWGISCWAMTTTVSGADIIFGKDGTGGTNPRQFNLMRSGASLAFYYWTAPGVYVYYDPGTAWLTANQWHHIVMQRAGSTFQFAVDGIIKATNAGTGSHGAMNAGTISARIGARVYSGLTDPWTGQLADFRVRTCALSAAEIWRLYDPQTRWELYQPPRPTVWWMPPVAEIRQRILGNRLLSMA